MPGVDFARLRAEITMVQVLDLLQFQLTARSGPQWYGYCPLHESSPHHRRVFSVNVDLRLFYCHRCRCRGNQLDLWVEATKLPFHRAMIELCERLGRDIPWVHRW